MTTQVAVNTLNGLDLGVLRETVEAVKQKPELGKCRFRASNTWIEGSQNRTTVSGFFAAGEERQHRKPFNMQADEPPMLAGRDEAPNPVEHLLHALASCVTTSLVAHAAVRGIPIKAITSELEGDINLRGFLGLADDVPKGYTNIRVKIKAKTDAENLKQLEALARYSPVLNTLTMGTNVGIKIEPA